MNKKLLVVILLILFTTFIQAAPSHLLNINRIEQLTSAKGQLDKDENVFKISVLHNDLNIAVAGVKLVPAMGLTSEVAFKQLNNHVMAMGDLVLLEDQVNPVMSTALANGLNVTALHNQYLWEKPRLMFMHIEGMGDEKTLATAVGKVFAKMKVTASDKEKVPTANIDPAKTTLNSKKIDDILGTKGAFDHGIYKIVIGRTAKMDGYIIGKSMDVSTWAAFAGSDDNAVVDGDFAMHESELQGVLKALRNADFYVVSIHQHMVGEEPRFIFLHFWAVGSTQALAKGLHAAFTVTGSS